MSVNKFGLDIISCFVSEQRSSQRRLEFGHALIRRQSEKKSTLDHILGWSTRKPFDLFLNGTLRIVEPIIVGG